LITPFLDGRWAPIPEPPMRLDLATLLPVTFVVGAALSQVGG